MSVLSQTCTGQEADRGAATILVAEDEVLIRAMLAHHLRSAGFRVAEAANADEAIEILDSGERVDVLFTDVCMPGRCNGVGLARWVRQHHPAIRIVFASGEKDLVHDIPDAKFFSKPYDFGDVENHIRNLLRGADRSEG